MNKAVFAFLGLFSAALGADTTNLFDGNSLAGWQVNGDAQWAVENGEIVSAGTGDGYLYSDAQFGDFELRAEFWVDATTNSGIYIRCQDRDNIHPDTCFELNIWDLHPKQEARTGSIVFKVMPPLAHVETIGRWNSYEVTARGSSLVVKVNGRLTATMDDADPAAGFIALQHWAEGTVKFRNIQLRPLAD
jgi:3-keto-disaccharide hydrolase